MKLASLMQKSYFMGRKVKTKVSQLIKVREFSAQHFADRPLALPPSLRSQALTVACQESTADLRPKNVSGVHTWRRLLKPETAQPRNSNPGTCFVGHPHQQ